MNTLPVIFLVFTLFSAVSLASCQSVSLTESKTEPKTALQLKREKQIQLLHAFKQAVIAKDQAKIMSMLRPSYVKNQHDDFLKGDTETFIGGLFCGNTKNTVDFMGSKRYRCIGLKNIQYIALSPHMTDHERPYYNNTKRKWTIITFFVNDAKEDTDTTVIAELLLSKENGKYYLSGGVG